MIGDYEDNAIRPHALGHFRDLLEATLRHPAMLRYLDNADNAAGHLNENYAREIMELHTMGVGSGYTQRDVEELARILTGVGIDLKPKDPKLKPELQPQLVRDGPFEFNPARHDYGDKMFLGHPIKGRGLAEVDEALDILCRQPATATRICRAARDYFVSRQPAAGAGRSAWRRPFRPPTAISPPCWRRCPRAGIHGLAEARRKFKDPVHYVISAVRLAYDDKVILNTMPDPELAQPPGRGAVQPRDAGRLSDDLGGLERPGQMMMRFEIARQIGSGSAGLFKPDVPDAADQPAFPLIQNALYFDV